MKLAMDDRLIALGALLLANLALSLLYFLVKRARRQGAGLTLFFIFLPGLGFLVYFVPILLRSFLNRVGVDREAVLTHAHDIERQPEHPNVREELDVVPVEDAMAISGTTERRTLLLNQLKKDMRENYKALLAAQEDEDSESAHYMAAAKMEIYRIQQARWMECRKDYEENPADPAAYHGACAALFDVLDSGVFSAREQDSYRKRLCDLVQHQIDADESVVTLNEFEQYLDSLVELGRYAQAEGLWQAHKGRMKSEASYQGMLKMFYQMGDRQKFENILEDLQQNRQVRLSPEGLEQLRYWSSRLANAPVHD